jgi:hypothetical protein
MKNPQMQMMATQPGRCSGAVTLAVSMAILVLSTLVTFNVSRAILMEQKITNNEQRAVQAFEAAETGMLQAFAYLSGNPDVDNNGVIDPVFDTNADGIGDTNTMAVGTGSVTVTVTDLAGDMSRLRIVARGFSDDRSATRTITQQMVSLQALPNTPANPVISRGSVVISGSATVHNQEGHSTIWSGGDVDLGSNNSTSTEVPDMTHPGYPACMDFPGTCVLATASNRTMAGVDVIEHDSSLGSLTATEFFQNFFGMTPQQYRERMVTIDTSGAAAGAAMNLAQNEVIWVEGNHSFNGGTVGCTTAVTGNNVCPVANRRPSIVIVNGDASFSGTPHFYGMLFVMGNSSSTGNVTIHGAMAIGGSASSSGGSFDIWYNTNILARASMSGAAASSAGTWKDF